MQHVAENKTCTEGNENKDQTSEISALKGELNVLKDLILRQVDIYIYIYGNFLQTGIHVYIIHVYESWYDYSIFAMYI